MGNENNPDNTDWEIGDQSIMISSTAFSCLIIFPGLFLPNLFSKGVSIHYGKLKYKQTDESQREGQGRL